MTPIFLVSIVNPREINWDAAPPQAINANARRRRDGDDGEIEFQGNTKGALPKGIKDCYQNLEEATKAAEELASSHPGAMVVLWSPSHVFEATKPQVLNKRFTTTGELIPDEPRRV